MEFVTSARLGPVSDLHPQWMLDRVAEAERVDSPDGWNRLLVQAAECNDLQVVQIALRRKADADAQWEGSSALHRAVKNGFFGLAVLLLEHGASVRACDASGAQPLHLAMHAGKASKKMLGLLLKAGADIDAVDAEGQTPLYRAVRHEQRKIVRWLLEHGATAATSSGQPSSLSAALRLNDYEIAADLVEHGAAPDEIYNHSLVLWHAIGVGHLRLATVLVEKGAQVNGDKSSSLLFHTLGSHHAGALHHLLARHGARYSPNETGRFDSGLMDFVFRRSPTIDGCIAARGLVSLMECEAWELWRSHPPQSLQRRSYEAWVDMIRGLTHPLERLESLLASLSQLPVDQPWTEVLLYELALRCEAVGAPPQGQDLSAQSASPALMARFEQARAHIRILQSKQMETTHLIHAVEQRNLSLVALLLRLHASTAVEDDDGHGPLYAAAITGQIDMVNLLIEHGAQVSLQDLKSLQLKAFAPDPLRQQILSALEQVKAS